MTYPVPYYLTLPLTTPVPQYSCLTQDDPGVPNGTYILDDWYCPAPDCDCQDVVFQVFAQPDHQCVAWIRWSLDPTHPVAPHLDQPHLAAPYAQALLQALTPLLLGDPAWQAQLREHYHQVKAVAADPTHPAYHRVIACAQTGEPSTAPPKKRQRRRH